MQLAVITEIWNAFKPYAVPVLIGLVAFIKRTTLARITAQVAHEYQVRLEEIKSAHASRQLVHRVQFEAEFEIYKTLWRDLSEWSSTFRTYRLMMSGTHVGKSEYQEALTKIFVDTYTELDKCFKALLAYKPFLYGTVHEEFNLIMREYDSEMFAYWTSKDQSKSTDWYKEREIALQNLEKRLYEDLSETIRRRIGLIDVLN